MNKGALWKYMASGALVCSAYFMFSDASVGKSEEAGLQDSFSSARSRHRISAAERMQAKYGRCSDAQLLKALSLGKGPVVIGGIDERQKQVLRELGRRHGRDSISILLDYFTRPVSDDHNGIFLNQGLSNFSDVSYLAENRLFMIAYAVQGIMEVDFEAAWQVVDEAQFLNGMDFSSIPAFTWQWAGEKYGSGGFG